MANNANTNEEKKKALDAAIAKLEKDFGKGAVMRLGDSSAHVAVEIRPVLPDQGMLHFPCRI